MRGGQGLHAGQGVRPEHRDLHHALQKGSHHRAVHVGGLRQGHRAVEHVEPRRERQVLHGLQVQQLQSKGRSKVRLQRGRALQPHLLRHRLHFGEGHQEGPGQRPGIGWEVRPREEACKQSRNDRRGEHHHAHHWNCSRRRVDVLLREEIPEKGPHRGILEFWGRHLSLFFHTNLCTYTLTLFPIDSILLLLGTQKGREVWVYSMSWSLFTMFPLPLISHRVVRRPSTPTGPLA
mmetsp:Transcript_10243/g.28983  ORF Transcript_10243/g.28983 Transcript_10243/m.28983 type:complete len:234 (-) Transcript_10243:1183-1884(-)